MNIQQKPPEYREGDWLSNPGPQTEALFSDAFETLYGGARGGGKTDAGLVWIVEPVENPNYRGLVIRRNSDDLSDWIDRASRLYQGLGATVAHQPLVIRFPSGALIRGGHLKDDQAYTKYQGHEYQRMLIEELTQIPDEKRYLQLVASCRSTIPGLSAKVFATTNPGGVGHGWVKHRFVDPAPPGQKFSDPNTGRTRIFIPAKVEDTPQLVENDPGYIAFLEGLKETDVELWKAWRLGDWDTFAGQYFKEFRRDLHVCKPFIPKPDLIFVGGMDWGRTAPFSFHSAVMIPQVYEEVKFNRVITFLEAYGTEKIPKEWAEIIQTKLKEFNLSVDNLKWIQADPSMFTKGQDGSISISDQFVTAHHDYYKIKMGSNDRVGGWELLHNWLSIAPDGLPYWMITENCVNLIRTLPELVHDELKVEDVDTQGEDHAADDQRYMFKALQWIDAKVGGVHPKRYTPGVRLIKSPLTSIDLSEFEKKERKTKDWRVI